MRTDYVIHPDGLALLRESGIEQRVLAAKAARNLNYISGVITKERLMGRIAGLHEDGIYRLMRRELVQKYPEKINWLTDSFGSAHWTVKKQSGDAPIQMEWDDFLLYIGSYASQVLSPDEMWNHEKFNFSTTSKFMGTVSAFVRQHAHGNGFCSDGYLWTREHQGIASECRIGSSENVEATLQLSQTDVSPYVVIDPFNSFTFCRPIVNADRAFVTMAKGSAVPLLASVLQYVKQYDLKPTVLQDGGQALIESSLKSLKAPQHDSNPNIEEIYQGRRDHFPMIRDTDRKVVKNTTHFIGSQIGYLYGLYANTKRQLVFSRQARDEPVTLLRKETMVFQDTDVDHLIRGLFAQTARGVGGVSVQDLAATLRYNGREKNESAPVVAAASAAAPASLPPTDATTV